MIKKLINYLGWAIILSAGFYFIYERAWRYLSYNPESYGSGHWAYAPWVFTHVAAGMTAFILGPSQFIPAIRKNYPTLHRTMGKIYLCCVMVAALASFELSISKMMFTENYVTNAAGLVALAFAWLLTSGMAYWAVRGKNFEQHREWMVRSFIVTCAFATIRLANKILTERFQMNPQVADDLLAWAGWAVPLLIAEVIMQGMKIRKGNLSLAKKIAHS